jgi:hypothetical protein
MKKLLIILVIGLLGCGQLVVKPDRVMYKALGGKLSCLGTRCCYPYGGKLIVCNEGNAHGDGVFIRYYYDK